MVYHSRLLHSPAQSPIIYHRLIIHAVDGVSCKGKWACWPLTRLRAVFSDQVLECLQGCTAVRVHCTERMLAVSPTGTGEK